jgi:phytoene desaturase
VEQFHQPGGRLNRLQKDGFSFDLAPSFFSMSYEFTQFSEDTGLPIPFEFIELDPLYTVHFRNDAKQYRIFKNLDKLAAQFENEEPNLKQKLEAYLKDTGRFFDATMDLVIRQNFDNKADYLYQLSKVPWRYAPMMTRSFWEQTGRYFESEKIREILSLVSFFLGATPFDTSAVYTLLSYTELVNDGYYNVRGGMYKIVEGLLSLMKQQQIDIQCNTQIVGYNEKNGNIESFVDSHGNLHHADVFVVNADAASFRGLVLGRKEFTPKKLDKMQWTMAPLTIYLGLDRKVEMLEQHNYFLGDNFHDYAKNVFKNSVTFDKPYYYVNTQSKHNPECAPEGQEALFILCPVPDMRFKPNWDDAETIAANIIADLSQRIGLDIEKHTVSKTILAPPWWEKNLGLWRGSGLSLGHKLTQIGGFRPKNFDEKFSNLFYVGSSTVPGTGLPMAMISSKLVAERIEKRM